MFGNSKVGVDRMSRIAAALVSAAALVGLATLGAGGPLAMVAGAVGLAAIVWLAWPTRAGASAVLDAPANPPLPEARSQAATMDAGAVDSQPGAAVEVAAVAADPAATSAYALAADPDGASEEIDDTFRRLLERGPVNLALIDQSGNVQEYSQALGALATMERTLIGSPFYALFEEKDHGALQTAIAAVGDGEVQEPVVARLAAGRKESCAVVFVELQDSPKLIAAGIQDVTQEKKLEAQFAQSQKMLAVGQLAGGVAHDFNNLLTAIIGHADLLMLKTSPSDESFADINQIKQNANRAANLVRQLLAFSRQQTLQPRVLDVGDVLSDLGNLLRRLLGAGVNLSVRHGRGLPLIKVDQVQLEQVLINLAVNGRDAMRGAGELTIATKLADVGDTIGTLLEPMPAGKYVQIDVVDQGSGIDAEHLVRIFEPFFTTKPLGEGTGLGLSTVYGIVKQTGGYVFVDSVIGEGSTFKIYLPPHLETEARVVEKTTERSRDLTGVGTIMLVEDEDPVRLFGARALRGKGYRVIEASTGEAALMLFKGGEADDVDLLVTDIVMPELDGPSLIAAARKYRPTLPVVCVSGYAESAFREKLAGIENIHFLPKPFTLNQLAGKVKDVIP